MSRYAIHHFPRIENVISQLNRILITNGQILISDPTINDIDKSRFVDKYMQLKDDGHIKFYSQNELEMLFKEYGILIERMFRSSIRFPRAYDDRYKELIHSVSEDVVNSYDIEKIDDNIYITLNVINILFRKKGEYRF